MDSFIQTISNYFAHIPQDWQWLLDNPEKGGSVIFSLIILESLLSVDNAAVLATMVMDLPKEQRGRALKYGILGAYFFRGLALIFAAVLVQYSKFGIEQIPLLSGSVPHFQKAAGVLSRLDFLSRIYRDMEAERIWGESHRQY